METATGIIDGVREWRSPSSDILYYFVKIGNLDLSTTDKELITLETEEGEPRRVHKGDYVSADYEIEKDKTKLKALKW